ncbi:MULTISPECIES: DUF7289 family protein [Halomicrobium]|uniref:Uncharacterized protein n=2 Tax=Halomicrobium mukohataei TaxID=57705 RepID=C7NWN9_HALMD|nr:MULTISPECIES: hypothetical protein [Halomicrobium]ACV48249.1 conserved hypothetical protein [Halomicrobium mukohataei DSM 12286]QCD66669.1 hypothetical protein E5139_13820 [Halomicrobium mukohataei]QFR21475.1 hypothetical protein GBQ70_13835 [Halomicrobium sp. ZPS1]
MTDRAVSEVLGFALVFGMVVASVAIISVSGLGTLQDVRDAEQTNNAQQAFDVLADNMADIHQRGAPSRATEVSLGSAQLYTGENVTINVTAIDRDTADGNESVERSVRPIVYESDGAQRLVYEGGAVFQVSRDGGFHTVEPPLVARDGRVLVPIVQTRTERVRSVGGSTVLVRANQQSSAVAVSGGQFENVSVTVTSPRWELWQRAFEQTALSECAPDPDAASVTCYLEPGASPDRLYVPVHEIDLTIEL